MTIAEQSEATAAEAVITEIVTRLALLFDPERIILFGSRARGDARDQSDVDLLVVMPNGTDRRATAAAMQPSVADMPLATDIVVTTPEVIERRGHLVTDVLRPALTEGEILHDRDPASPLLARAVSVWTNRMSSVAADDPDATAAALTWLRWAREEIRGVQSDLALDPPLVNRACYTSQMIAERALKAAYQLEGTGIVRTHDVHDLAETLREGWAIDPEYGALEWLADWNTRGRYPGDLPEATLSDAERAEGIAQSVYDNIAQGFRLRGVDPLSGPGDPGVSRRPLPPEPLLPDPPPHEPPPDSNL